MRRNQFLLVAVMGAAMAISGAAVAFAGGSAAPPVRATVSSGTPVARDSLSPNDQDMLARIGATGPITRLGALSGTTFYEIRAGDGGECFAFGLEAQGGGLSGGCLGGSGQLTDPVVDMSIVAMNPADGTFQFRTVQGIAADGVSAVGVIDAGGIVHATPVVGNIYRMADGAVPMGPIMAFVALDASGSTIYTKPLIAG